MDENDKKITLYVCCMQLSGSLAVVRSVVNFCIMLSLLSFDTFTVTPQIEKGFCRNFPLVSAVIF